MKARQILDVIHGYVEVPDPIAGVLSLPALQRLRRVSQTALVSSVYPSANGTRFEHSLGTMHLAREAFMSAWSNTDDKIQEVLVAGVNESVPNYLRRIGVEAAEQIGAAVAAVGLLHDIGHPPFSHALEEYFRRNAATIFEDAPSFIKAVDAAPAVPFHEIAGETLVRGMQSGFATKSGFDLFRHIYRADPDGDGWASALHAIVSSLVDVDRMDYIMRDGHHAGTEYGSVDWRRLVGSLEFRLTELGSIRLALGLRARSAAELLLVQRMQAYRWMYQHPRVVASEALLRSALEEVETIRREGSSSPLAFQAVKNLTPPLNYVVNSSAYRISGLSVRRLDAPHSSGREEVETDLQLELPLELVTEEDVANPTQTIFAEIQASVTDDAITRYLSSLAVVFKHASNLGQYDPRAERFLHLYDASLRRSSALVLLWKRHEEYADLASTLVANELVRKVIANLIESAKVDVLDKLGTPPDETKALLAQLERVCSSPIEFLNYAGYRILYRKEREFGDWLTEAAGDLEGHRGFWHGTFSGKRDPLRSFSAGVQLEGSDDTSVSLRDTSPLVASIDDVERSSAQFHAFFVMTSHGMSVLPRAELRRRLRSALAETMPGFLRQVLSTDTIGTKASLTSLFEVVKREIDVSKGE